MGYYYTAVIKEGKIVSGDLKSTDEGSIALLPNKILVEYMDTTFSTLICEKVSGNRITATSERDCLELGITDGHFSQVSLRNVTEISLTYNAKEVLITYPGNVKYRIYCKEEYDEDFDEAEADWQ